MRGGVFNVGASLRLQQFIDSINDQGYGGIEYLYSVPGLVGGAVVMNAGRGKTQHKVISDYINSIEALDKNGNVIVLKKEECNFQHRSSVFKNGDLVITSVLFEFPKMSAEESTRLKKERIALCKEHQDTSKPNFGSVFCENNIKIMKFARKYQIGSGDVHFSNKTANWLLKGKNGGFDDAIAAMKKVELIHKVLFKKCVREVIVWE